MDNIMFDLYGTLIDINTDESKDVFWESFCENTKKYKVYDYLDLKAKYLLKCEELHKLKEEIELLDVFKYLFECDEIVAKEIALIFRKLSTKYIKKYRGVDKLLMYLKEKGCKIYLLSNAQASFTIPEMLDLDLVKYFDGIAISSDYGVKKPNKDFYLKAMESYGITSENTWMVGNDYECDIYPANKLGLKTIYIESNLSPDRLKVEKIKGFSFRKVKKAFKFK